MPVPAGRAIRSRLRSHRFNSVKDQVVSETVPLPSLLEECANGGPRTPYSVSRPLVDGSLPSSVRNPWGDMSHPDVFPEPSITAQSSRSTSSWVSMESDWSLAIAFAHRPHMQLKCISNREMRTIYKPEIHSGMSSDMAHTPNDTHRSIQTTYERLKRHGQQTAEVSSRGL